MAIPIIEILTLIGVSLDLCSTVVLACLSGHCESDCCGECFHFSHVDAENSIRRETSNGSSNPEENL